MRKKYIDLTNNKKCHVIKDRKKIEEIIPENNMKKDGNLVTKFIDVVKDDLQKIKKIRTRNKKMVDMKDPRKRDHIK